MPKFYVTEGNTIRHDGETYQEGEAITMEARAAKPKLESGLLTKENWADKKPTSAKQSATGRSKKSKADLKAAQDARNKAADEAAAAKEAAKEGGDGGNGDGDGGDGGDGQGGDENPQGDENPDGGDGGQ